MRVAVVYALPFHRWVLADLVASLVTAGVDVVEFGHTPAGPHDWVSGRGGDPVRAALVAGRPWDAVLMAEYPYGHLRDAAGAPVVTTRHSLASRANTWEPEQGDADWIVTWSAWDEAEFARRGVAPRRGFLRAGCVWADRVRAAPGRTPGAQVVLWAPTWNAELSARDVVVAGLTELHGAGWSVRVRPHPATLWREPGVVRSWDALGFRVDATDGHPAASLSTADVVVCDVSGIALLAACLPDARTPVVQVSPVVVQSRQADWTGPEWTMRADLGPRCVAGVAVVVRSVVSVDPWRESRASVARTVAGPPDATRRAAGMVVEVLGG